MEATTLEPLINEFENASEATGYDVWLRAKVQQSLADTTPNRTHDEAVAFVEAELARRKAARAAG